MVETSILLVEDDPLDIELVSELLGQAKLLNELHVVGDGVEALRFLHREGRYKDAPTPGLVLLDMNLPKMDGAAFLAEIRRDPELSGLPVAALAPSAVEAELLEKRDLGANCYIAKPVDLIAIVRVVATVGGLALRVVHSP